MIRCSLVRDLILLFSLTVARSENFVFNVVMACGFHYSFFRYGPITYLSDNDIAYALFLLLRFHIRFFRICDRSIFTRGRLYRIRQRARYVVWNRNVFTTSFCFSNDLNVFRYLIRRASSNFRYTRRYFFFFFSGFLSRNFLYCRFEVDISRIVGRCQGRLMRRYLFLSRRDVSMAGDATRSATGCVAHFYIEKRLAIYSERDSNTSVINSRTRDSILLFIFSMFYT